ncbi:hypothetical protein NTGBS_100016 [Candidatus Nitrotoga sp. BS]|nr:hypothetical protein NTGBS_100016 [Candidatus Nitrotoga sp. BS]
MYCKYHSAAIITVKAIDSAKLVQYVTDLTASDFFKLIKIMSMRYPSLCNVQLFANYLFYEIKSENEKPPKGGFSKHSKYA